MDSILKCIKCFSQPSFNKKHHLCPHCYQREYRLGMIPKDGFSFWGEKGPYEDDPEDWARDFVTLVNDFLFQDPERGAIVYVVRSKRDFERRLDQINKLKRILKNNRFEVRDDLGNMVTYYHDFYKDHAQTRIELNALEV